MYKGSPLEIMVRGCRAKGGLRATMTNVQNWPQQYGRVCGHVEQLPCEDNAAKIGDADAKKSVSCAGRKTVGEDKDRHLKEPFTGAPFGHPFRHPSYHATQFRAVHFAKAHGRRLHWVVAYDRIKEKTSSVTNEEEELRKERWLEFHDRCTPGIPGLVPLDLDLPVRFTESIGRQAREMGVFKHTRGTLRGWELEGDERPRLEATQEPEVVLKRRPLRLHIAVPTATSKMPKVDGVSIFVLKVQQKQWSLYKQGNIKICRYGFPIAPDLGGTAHAYCGSTIEATLGDLLPWYKKPQMQDMLKAYIIKSRIREADRLLLVQPYSPHLFRLGILPGPQLLFDVLTGKLTHTEAEAAWKKIAKKKKQRKDAAGPWLTEQTIPCR